MSLVSFNRTFMELKCRLERVPSSRLDSFNRTFMELKCLLLCCYACLIFVLIVPLWNWNDASVEGTKEWVCFNRTFMELKLKYEPHNILCNSVLIVPLWNWNIWSIYFNLFKGWVLIVPLWNWNAGVPLSPDDESVF